MNVLLSDQLSLRVKRELRNIVQLLQCYLRASELEMRAAEEPLKSDLDVTGLKALVLERIEVLEEQERERQELLAEVVPFMESRGYDPAPIREVIGRVRITIGLFRGPNFLCGGATCCDPPVLDRDR